MSNFFTNIVNTIRNSFTSVWKQMKILHKIIAIVIILAVIGGVVLVSTISSRSDKVFIFSSAITDLDLLTRITNRLDLENIVYQVDTTNRIIVKNKSTAQYARGILVRENLIPQDLDPWSLFDTERWTQTDFERNINLQRALTKQLEQHISALDDVDSANVTLVIPKDTLFSEDRNPVTASVILSLKPGSDFRENRKKIEGVERLILLAIEGISKENLTISDTGGVRLNDFESFADFDNLELTKREIKIKNEYEAKYKEYILKALSDIYTPDRVRIVNIDVQMDFNKKSSETTENYPIVVTADNPDTPYDETEVVLSIPRSQENISENYKGTGFNPQGPPGVEGQVPPSYKDLDGIVGSWDHKTEKVNNEINQRKTVEEVRPTVARVSASIAIDGVWKWQYDDKGTVMQKPNGGIDRLYIPLTNVELRQALALVKSAVAFSIKRGDNVSVENVQFDRNTQFNLEDQSFIRKQLTKKIVFWSSISLVVLVILIFFLRFLSQQWEQYKLKKEERLIEKYRKMREAQIMSMREEEEEEEEETELQKLIRDVVAIVSENPQNVSLLVRSWMED